MAKTPTKPLSVKEQTIQLCELIPQNWVTNPEPRGNTAALLYNLIIWQTLCKETADRLKAAWDELQTPSSGFSEKAVPIVETDDDMRDRGAGEHIVFETKCFSIVATVTAGRKTFDAEAFAEAAAKKWRIKAADILALMEAHKPKGKPTLSKRVLEAS